MEITKQSTHDLAQTTVSVLQKALNEAGLGLTVTYTKGSYDPAIGECTLTFKFNGGEDTERKAFEYLARMYGLKPEHYGEIITDGHGSRYKLCGFNTKAPRYPIQARSITDGKTYRFTEHVVKSLREQS